MSFYQASSSATKTFYFEDYLEDIHYLLQKYSKSVITLIIKNALDKVGLSKYLLTQNHNINTVTFGYMRNTDERLVVFLENGLKTATNNIYTTAYYKETTYSLEKDQQCIDRKENRVPFADTNVNIFLLNHFYSKSCNENLGLASIAKHKCSEVNDYDKIIDRFNLCKKAGNVPTFIGIDFIENGDNGGSLKAIGYANSFITGRTIAHTHSSTTTTNHSLWLLI